MLFLIFCYSYINIFTVGEFSSKLQFQASLNTLLCFLFFFLGCVHCEHRSSIHLLKSYLQRAASQMKVGLKGRGIEQKKLVSNNT